jgi:hypothetical protein
VPVIDIIGVLLVVVGLLLVLTDLPKVAATTADAGLWPIIKEIFQRRPRTALGLILIILGLLALGVDIPVV